MEDSTETVQVGVSSSKARFAIGTITLTSKLIDGTFPDYGRVIPKSNDKDLKVPNADFKAPSTAYPPSPASAGAR